MRYCSRKIQSVCSCVRVFVCSCVFTWVQKSLIDLGPGRSSKHLGPLDPPARQNLNPNAHLRNLLADAGPDLAMSGLDRSCHESVSCHPNWCNSLASCSLIQSQKHLSGPPKNPSRKSTSQGSGSLWPPQCLWSSLRKNSSSQACGSRRTTAESYPFSAALATHLRKFQAQATQGYQTRWSSWSNNYRVYGKFIYWKWAPPCSPQLLGYLPTFGSFQNSPNFSKIECFQEGNQWVSLAVHTEPITPRCPARQPFSAVPAFNLLRVARSDPFQHCGSDSLILTDQLGN